MANLNGMKDDFFTETPESVSIMDDEASSISYELLSGMMTEALVVLDFKKKAFQYVPNHDLCLCGHTQETPKLLGFDFSKESIHPKDLPFWIDIHNTIVDGLNNNELLADKVNYFSFRIRVKSALSSKKNPDYLMIYVKLKPKWVNGQLRYGICLLSASVIRKPDKQLTVHYHDMDYSEYSLKTKKWTHHPFSPLSKRQKEMLVWSHQGFSMKEIAEKMCISYKTIDNIRQKLFDRFEVNSIEQAILFALNRRLIYHPPPIQSLP